VALLRKATLYSRHPTGLRHPVVTSRTKCDLAVLWKVAGDMNHVPGMSHVTLRNEPCCTSELVTSHIWMSHVTRNTSEVKPRVLVIWYKDAGDLSHTLQHTATHCHSMQHSAALCNTLQHTAAYCNALQHTAAHCNTLQHTAAHCNTHLNMTCYKVAGDMSHVTHSIQQIESCHTYE